MSKRFSKRFKIILIGDAAVGKTTLRRRFMGQNFKTDYLYTLGVDFASKTIEMDEYSAILQIWDIAGQVGFASVRETYYKDTMGIILVFDLTNMDSFNNLPNWIEEFLQISKGTIVPLVIIGNKTDLINDNNRLITKDQIDEKVKSIEDMINKVSENVGLVYYETSAKLNLAVEEAFLEITGMMSDFIGE